MLLYKHVCVKILLSEQYQLQNKVYNNHVYIKIQKGMYGLKHAGILAYYNHKTYYRTLYKIYITNVFLCDLLGRECSETCI